MRILNYKSKEDVEICINNFRDFIEKEIVTDELFYVLSEVIDGYSDYAIKEAAEKCGTFSFLSNIYHLRCIRNLLISGDK